MWLFQEIKIKFIYVFGDEKMLTLFLIVSASVGLTHILVDGSIINPFKNWLKNRKFHKILELLNCYQCAGFWSGIICSSLYMVSHLYDLHWLNVILYGFATSFYATLGAVLIAYFNISASERLENGK